jgi:hypothetical protein
MNNIFPNICFIRLTAHESAEIDRMIYDAKKKGRSIWSEEMTSATRGDVMLLCQYDAIMAAYRHWLNWGFNGIPAAPKK